VRDEGIGLPDHLNPKASSGTGFTIINLLMKQLNADWEVDTDQGTMVRFSFEVDTLTPIS
jgi:two-component sensor histidine kinase